MYTKKQKYESNRNPPLQGLPYNYVSSLQKQQLSKGTDNITKTLKNTSYIFSWVVAACKNVALLKRWRESSDKFCIWALT